MARSNTKKRPERGQLTPLQQQVVALWASGASDQKVAEQLQVPLPWLEGLSTHLLVQEALAKAQWRLHHRQAARLRSLVHQAMGVLEEELEAKPTPELALQVLRVSGKLLAPEAPIQKAEEVLYSRCEQQARSEREKKRNSSSPSPDDLTEEAAIREEGEDLYQELAPTALASPADPEPGASL
jgi:hypothetical protein